MDEGQSQRGQAWLEELLNLSGLTSTIKSVSDPAFAEDSCWLQIDDSGLTPEQVEAIIGPGGVVLDSVQYLMNTILNLGQTADKQGAFTVELAGYRLQRYSELQTMAEQAVSHVRETGEEFELKSLSSAERRQVHTLLKEYADLETYSRGQEPDRRLVVRLMQD